MAGTCLFEADRTTERAARNVDEISLRPAAQSLNRERVLRIDCLRPAAAVWDVQSRAVVGEAIAVGGGVAGFGRGDRMLALLGSSTSRWAPPQSAGSDDVVAGPVCSPESGCWTIDARRTACLKVPNELGATEALHLASSLLSASMALLVARPDANERVALRAPTLVAAGTMQALAAAGVGEIILLPCGGPGAPPSSQMTTRLHECVDLCLDLCAEMPPKPAEKETEFLRLMADRSVVTISARRMPAMVPGELGAAEHGPAARFAAACMSLFLDCLRAVPAHADR